MHVSIQSQHLWHYWNRVKINTPQSYPRDLGHYAKLFVEKVIVGKVNVYYLTSNLRKKH